jgi:hypothetical protein
MPMLARVMQVELQAAQSNVNAIDSRPSAYLVSRVRGGGG